MPQTCAKSSIAKSSMLTREQLERAAANLRVLAHPARLHMVQVLMHGRHPVGELAERCGIQPHQASAHLRRMEAHGLLARRREGRTIYYGIVSPTLPGLIGCIERHLERPPLPTHGEKAPEFT